MLFSTRSIGAGLGFISFGVALAVLAPALISWGWTLGAAGLFICVIGMQMKKRFLVLLGALVIFSAAGLMRAGHLDPVRTPEADRSIDQTVEVRGTIWEDPDRREESVQYVLRAEEVDRRRLLRPVSVLVSLPRHPEYRVGDEFILSGRFVLPKDFEADAVRPPFPYVKYLAKDGIGYVMRFPEVKSARGAGERSILRMLSGWKRSIL